jgi:DNA repair protein RadD
MAAPMIHDAPPRPTLTLRPYQRAAIDAAYTWSATNEGNCLLVVPTGGGKSLIMGTMAKEAVDGGARVLVIAHRKELIEQNWKAMQSAGLPALSCGLISGQHGKKDRTTPATVGSIQTLARSPYTYGPFDLILVDECFVAGTLVSTPSGDVPIERLSPGDLVYNAAGVGEVIATSVRDTTTLITVELTDGDAFTCTPNHPIFTDEGFVEAGRLEVGTRLYRREDVRELWQRVPAVDQKGFGREACESDEAQSMGAAAVLQHLLLEIEGECDVRPRRSTEDEVHTQGHWASAARAGRQWDRADSIAMGVLGDPRERVGRGACDTNWSKEDWHRHVLQAGPRTHEPENRDRVGGAHAQREAIDRGREEGCVSRVTRVARVSRIECGRGTSVFNLHVSGHPSYFAAGVLAHNCHLVPKNDDTSYRKFLDAMRTKNPHIRTIGLTATPYRLDSGRLDAGEGRVFHEIAYEIAISTLLDGGFLAPLISKATLARYDVTGVAMRGGEYVEAALQSAVDDPETTKAVVSELAQLGGSRSRWLVFCAGVQHAEHMAEALTGAGFPAAAVHGNLSAHERTERLLALRAGRLRALTNCDVLTTGYDEPSIDLLALCRPTASTGLHVQMLGRGFRTAPGKVDCLVLDFSGNCLRHGPVDAVKVRDPKKKREGDAPAKVCPQCQEVVGTATRVCPRCQHEFPPPERAKLAPEALLAPVMSREKLPPKWWDVTDVEFSRHEPKDPAKRATLRVDYKYHFQRVASEWVCIEHDGFAREKAVTWWADHLGGECPSTIDEALERTSSLEKPVAIALEPDGKFERVVNRRFHDHPQTPTAPLRTNGPCVLCAKWDEILSTCTQWNATPPDEVRLIGCDAFVDFDAALSADDLLPF